MTIWWWRFDGLLFAAFFSVCDNHNQNSINGGLWGRAVLMVVLVVLADCNSFLLGFFSHAQLLPVCLSIFQSGAQRCRVDTTQTHKHTHTDTRALSFHSLSFSPKEGRDWVSQDRSIDSNYDNDRSGAERERRREKERKRLTPRKLIQRGVLQ